MGSLTYAASTSDNDNDHSDLTNIRGIGVSRKRWLNSIGIYTIADLSQTSVDKIESQLKNNGRLLSRSELEEWITQAQAQAQAYATDKQHQQAETTCNQSDALSETELANASLTVSTNASLAVSTTDWTPIAVFNVEYQIRQTTGTIEQRTLIHHLETNTTEHWTGFETQLIQPWMLDRIEATLPQLETEDSVAPEVIVPEAIVPAITQLRVIQLRQVKQPMIADLTCPLFPSAIPTNEPFALEVSIQLTGLSDINLQEQIPCNIQCRVHDVSTGSTTTLGEVIANVPLTNQAIYNALLPELMLSRPGIYRLKVFVTLQNSRAAHIPAAFGYFKVPMLQVV